LADTPYPPLSKLTIAQVSNPIIVDNNFYVISLDDPFPIFQAFVFYIRILTQIKIHLIPEAFWHKNKFCDNITIKYNKIYK